MFEGVRRAMLMSMGLAALSWEKAQSVIDELVSKGDITAEEGRRLAEEMISKVGREGQSMSEKMKAQIRENLREMGIAESSRVDALEMRVQMLEARLNEASESEVAVERLD